MLTVRINITFSTLMVILVHWGFAEAQVCFALPLPAPKEITALADH
tara:strand:- start:1371 stop:1508 length:138 start_codon:yes stop_codon:yes gene_type:complete